MNENERIYLKAEFIPHKVNNINNLKFGNTAR